MPETTSPERRPCQNAADADILPLERRAPEAPRNANVRRSRMGKRRAWVLLLVHVVLFAHILHWQLAGETLTPVEPSEAMFTVAKGAVNAGFLLLVLTVLSTLVLGRWFCGWACHLVALQDASSWLLARLGFRPRPIRSRLLVWVPLCAALYMFLVSPLGNRLTAGEGLPELELHLTETEFWDTFPGLTLAVITFLVSGFFIVWLLGSKGFCTYACPYGGLFGVADRLAPGRIRATDACKGCGHCTAVCTSNVLVHKEVRQFQMVVDPGCMKCADCVSVCPENALYFGFGRPALFARKKRQMKLRPTGLLAWSEELVALAVFLVAFLIYNGLPGWLSPSVANLYGRMPLLLALACSAMTALAAVFFLRLFWQKDLSLQGHDLKEEGRLRGAGLWMGAVLAAILATTAHAGVVQYHTFRGLRAFQDTEIGELAWNPDPAARASIPPEVLDAAEEARHHFDRAEALGFATDLRLPIHRGWLAIVQGDPQAAAAEYEQVLSRAPTHVATILNLARLRMMQGDKAGGAELLDLVTRLVPDKPQYRERLGTVLFELDQKQEALRQMEEAVRLEPDSAYFHFRLGLVRTLATGDPRAGIEQARRAAALAPDDPNIARLAGQLLIQAGEVEEGRELMRRAEARQP